MSSTSRAGGQNMLSQPSYHHGCWYYERYYRCTAFEVSATAVRQLCKGQAWWPDKSACNRTSWYRGCNAVATISRCSKSHRKPDARHVCRPSPPRARRSSTVASTQINQAATEGEICQYILQSWKSFEHTLYKKVNESRIRARGLGGDGGTSADVSTADDAEANISPESSAKFIVTLVRELKEGSASDGIVDTIMAMLKDYSHDFNRLQHAADR